MLPQVPKPMSADHYISLPIIKQCYTLFFLIDRKSANVCYKVMYLLYKYEIRVAGRYKVVSVEFI